MADSSSTAQTRLTRPRPTVWQINLSNPPDHRLTPALLQSLSDDLDRIESEWRTQSGSRDTQGPMSDPKSWGEHRGAGAVVITGSDRFFSNGLDYSKAMGNPRFFEDVFDPVMYRLLTFPLVTIAAINGHAFAGGMGLALACDFRLITAGKGLMCMNELSFGSPIPNSFAAILKAKIPNPSHLRDTMLAKRWTQPELLGVGLVDAVVEPDQIISRAIEKGKEEGVKIGSGAWGKIKDGLYHEVIDASRSLRPVVFPKQEAKEFWERAGRERAKL